MKFRLFSLNSSKEETQFNLNNSVAPDSNLEHCETIKSTEEDFPNTIRTSTIDEFAIRRET